MAQHCPGGVTIISFGLHLVAGHFACAHRISPAWHRHALHGSKFQVSLFYEKTNIETKTRINFMFNRFASFSISNWQTWYVFPSTVHIDLASAIGGQCGQHSPGLVFWNSGAHSSTGHVLRRQIDVPFIQVHVEQISGAKRFPSAWKPFPNIHLPGNWVIIRFSLHRGQHSPGVLICFDGGHCSTGQAFFIHVSFLFEHEHFRHGSSLSVTSLPSYTIWPFNLQPANEREKKKGKLKRRANN